MHRRLQDRFDAALTIVELFRFPTVAALAARLASREGEAGGLAASEERANLRQARRTGRGRGRAAP